MLADGDEAAFPIDLPSEGVFHEGMSLRDWFAGHALAALIQSGRWKEDHPSVLPERAYEYADYMLKVREWKRER